MAVINLNRKGQIIDISGLVITNDAVYDLIREMEGRHEEQHHHSDNDHLNDSFRAEL